MRDWSLQTLGSFTERVRDINADGRELEPLSVTKGEGVVLQSTRFNKRVATDLRKYQIVRRGDFIFDPMSLYYGAVGRLDVIEEGVTSPDYVVFRASESVHPDFLLYLLRWPRMTATFEANSETGNRAGKRRRLYWSGFRELAVNFPPLPEQRKIAAILSSVDEAIEKTQAVIDQLQVVKKALMQELLTRGLPGRHKKFKQTEIGEIPESWRILLLKDVLTAIEAGWSPSCESTPPANGEWGVLKVSAVSGGSYRPQESKRYLGESPPRPEIEVRPGDVLLARASGALELVGMTVLVDATPARLMLSDKTLRLKPRSSHINNRFLHLIMSHPPVREQLLTTTGGSHMRNISQASLNQLRLPVPPLDEQLDIGDAVAALSHRIASEDTSLSHMQSLKQSLMSVLLTGELRVTPS